MQMRKKAMFFEQAFNIAHGAVMALDEDSAARGAHHSGGGKRARAGR